MDLPTIDDAQQRAAWNDYVPQHLLPRLHAFELMMAPYAIAHMKIGLKLADTGYGFQSEQRLRVFLTNSLEPPTDLNEMLEFVALLLPLTAVNLSHEALDVPQKMLLEMRPPVLAKSPCPTACAPMSVLWCR